MSYLKHYLKAIDNPLPELKKTFEEEFDFLKDNLKQNYRVLDMGCGAGRPAIDLAPSCRKIIGIENDHETFKEAKNRCAGVANLELIEFDALNTNFDNNSFDFVYATYNLIGSIPIEDRQSLVDEMVRVAKEGVKVVIVTWRQDDNTTNFLKKYYSDMGMNVIEIDNSKTVCDRNIFYRVAQDNLLKYYKKAGLNNIEFKAIGTVWLAIIGKK